MTKNIDSVKYEEILKEPIRTTINISRYLNLPISVREAKIIWKKVGLKNLKNYNLVDLSLDTFPYPGVTTSFESIWMGVPVLTKKGNNFVSRCGASIMENAGLTEFIANDEEDYFNKAISFANDIEKLDTIRKNLREKTKNSPLFDAETFGNDFSKLVKEMWANYVSNKSNK